MRKGRTGGIYCIYSKSKGHCYVGSASYIKPRIASHRAALNHKRHHSNILQNHFNKYGKEDLDWEILEEISDTSLLIEREQFYIDTLKPHFNVCPVAGRCEGRRMTEETREKLRQANLGKKLSEETKRKIGISGKGRKHRPESIEKLKLINKGRYRSEATREKLRQANLGKKATPEAIANMSAAWYKSEANKTHLEKVSKNNVGRKWTPEYREHMEAIMATPEYKAKISETSKGRKWSEERLARYKETINNRRYGNA